MMNAKKEGTDTQLTRNQLQLPFGISKHQSADKIAHFDADIKQYRHKNKHGRQTAKLTMLGNTSLWDMPKTAFLSSDKYSAGSVLKSLDWAAGIKDTDRCIMSGFHSKLEKSVFELIFKTGSAPMIWVLARGMFTSQKVRSYLETGRLLMVSQFDASIKERSRERATERNQFVVNNAVEVVYAHIREGGMLSQLKIPDGVPLRVLDRE